MEHLHYEFSGGRALGIARSACIVGVVASGNLEVLIEPAALDGGCTVEVATATQGYGAIWQAVMRDFFDRHRLGDVRVSINDAGATPAIVSLRLDQAVEAYRGGPH